VNYWPEPDQSNGVCQRPGIYRFTIEQAGVYVGRYTRSSRVLGEYLRNVRKLIEQRPDRKSKPDGFRLIHIELHRAVVEGRAIKLEILENCPCERLNERERHWIDQVPQEIRLNGKHKNACSNPSS
jgi:hypothetical protein